MLTQRKKGLIFTALIVLLSSMIFSAQSANTTTILDIGCKRIFWETATVNDLSKLKESNYVCFELETGETINYIHFAVWIASDEVFEEFLKRGPDVNTPTYMNQTPLIYAAGRGDVEKVKMLLDNGARTDIKTDHGYTALDTAKGFNHEEIVLLLENS